MLLLATLRTHASLPTSSNILNGALCTNIFLTFFGHTCLKSMVISFLCQRGHYTLSPVRTNVIPMRRPVKSRRQKKAGSSLRDFHESPWGVSRSSFHHPRGESGNPRTPITISIKAPFSIPGKPREGGSKNKSSSASRGCPRRKAQATSTSA